MTLPTRCQVALKHDVKSFLEQPVVHSFMRSEWKGGGINELLVDDYEFRKVFFTWSESRDVTLIIVRYT